MLADGSDASGTISNTGYNSTNVVSSKVSNSLHVDNDTTICLTNNSTQSASSGSANVSQNTTGGSATTGAASNNNSATFSVSVTN